MRTLASPLAQYIPKQELQVYRDLPYEEGFRKLGTLIEKHVEHLAEQILLDTNLRPEELKKKTEELRIYQGILDIPKRIEEVVCKK